MYKISNLIVCSLFVFALSLFTQIVSADDCIAPVTMSCTYVEADENIIDATVVVNYAVDGATTLDLASVVFSGNCDATAIGVGVEAIDPTHDTEVEDTNPCADGDMKIRGTDMAADCTVNTTANGDGVCDPNGTGDDDPDGECTAGDTTIMACMVDADCDTFSASSIDCTKTIEDIDLSACDMEIAVIAESSNLHDRTVEDSKDCNGRNCKKDDDFKGHDRGTVLCTMPEI